MLTPRHAQLCRLLHSADADTRQSSAALLSNDLLLAAAAAAAEDEPLLTSLLNAIHLELCSSSWDARVAASACLTMYYSQLPPSSPALDSTPPPPLNIALALSSSPCLLASDVPSRVPTIRSICPDIDLTPTTLPRSPSSSAEVPAAADDHASSLSIRQQVQQALRECRRQQSQRPTVLPLASSQELPVTLARDLLDGDWMVRHGGALGLKALAPRHLPPHASTYLLLVLLLDSFTDYSLPSVITPTRETAAQVLALCPSPPPLELLCQLASYPRSWAIRYSGLVALKYVLLARPGTWPLPLDLSAVLQHDPSPDCVAAAAAIARLVLPPGLECPPLTPASPPALLPLCLALGRSPPPDVLAAFLVHPDPATRACALQLLPAGSDLIPLRQCLDPDPSVRAARPPAPVPVALLEAVAHPDPQQQQQQPSLAPLHSMALCAALPIPDLDALSAHWLSPGLSISQQLLACWCLCLSPQRPPPAALAHASALLALFTATPLAPLLRALPASVLTRACGLVPTPAHVACPASPPGEYSREALTPACHAALHDARAVQCAVLACLLLRHSSQQPLSPLLKPLLTLLRQAPATLEAVALRLGLADGGLDPVVALIASTLAAHVPPTPKLVAALAQALPGSRAVLAAMDVPSPDLSLPLPALALLAKPSLLPALPPAACLAPVYASLPPAECAAALLARLDPPAAAAALPLVAAALPRPPLAACFFPAALALAAAGSRPAAALVARLIQLMPLCTAPLAPSLPPALLRAHAAALDTLAALQAGPAPAPPDGVLRDYQRQAVGWLLFLARHGLNGLLADDLGLGKTLVVLRTLQLMMPPDPPSLVVCPATLLATWKAEADKWVPGLDIVRDQPSLPFAFVVVDEAHRLRNPASKAFERVCALKSRHRVAVTGTPLHNDVVDLWALFEFLQPGYLGTLAEFKHDFAEPLRAMRADYEGLDALPPAAATSEATTAKARAIALAVEERAAKALSLLHQRVLPLTLRRLKKDVLAELPPKVIRDVPCALSPLARGLYHEAQARASASLLSNKRRPTEAFATLRDLLEVCTHPLLLLRRLAREAPDAVSRHLAERRVEQAKREPLAGKLAVLVDVLLDAGVGVQQQQPDEPPHRALVFAQWQRSLDLLEELLFAPGKPLGHLRFLRLDGNVPPLERQRLAERFNADAGVAVLLLTTSVGGHGLSLTGADLVVFLEHDWNPQNDLQAMDRAHRLGQRRAVSVARLVASDTVEDRLMSVQRFKLLVADAVVNEHNAHADHGIEPEELVRALRGGEVMEGEALLTQNEPDMLAGVPRALRTVLAEVGQLWAQEQYDEAFSEDGFRELVQLKQLDED